jgi:hypothetical protein
MISKLNPLMKCQRFQDGQPVGEPFDANKNGHENPGDGTSDSDAERYPKHGPIPPGEYDLLPKEVDGNFPVGTPSITTPGQPAGTITGKNGAPNRSQVLVHPEVNGVGPDSQGCVTVCPADSQSVKDLMDKNKGKTKFKIREVDCDCLVPDPPTQP